MTMINADVHHRAAELTATLFDQTPISCPRDSEAPRGLSDTATLQTAVIIAVGWCGMFPEVIHRFYCTTLAAAFETVLCERPAAPRTEFTSPAPIRTSVNQKMRRPIKQPPAMHTVDFRSLFTPGRPVGRLRNLPAADILPHPNLGHSWPPDRFSAPR